MHEKEHISLDRSSLIIKATIIYHHCWRLYLGRVSEEEPTRLRIWERSLMKTCIMLPLFWEPIVLASSLLSSRSLMKIGFLERIHDQPHSHHSFTELPTCFPMSETDLDLGNRDAISDGWFRRLSEREERRRRITPCSSLVEGLRRWETGREAGLRIWRVSIIELIAFLTCAERKREIWRRRRNESFPFWSKT